MSKNWIKLNPYNNPFQDKLEDIDKKIDEAIRLMKEEDDKKFQTFFGWKWFKFK